MRTPLKVDVIRDRGSLVRETTEGLAENVYRLQIMNTDERPRRFVVSVIGLPTLQVVADQPVHVAGAVTEAVVVAVRADPTVVPAGSHPIVFHVEDADDAAVAVDEKSRFFVR